MYRKYATAHQYQTDLIYNFQTCNARSLSKSERSLEFPKLIPQITV